MTVQRLWFAIIFNLFISCVQAGRYDWLLYSSEEKGTHCFLNGYRYFCRSTYDDILLEQETSMECLDGNLLSFSILRQNNVTTDMLIQWLIPFHLIEQYAEVLDSTYNSSSDNITICQCAETRFGVNCEYELASRQLAIAIHIKAQRDSKTQPYETLTSFIDEITCNTDETYLEWRQICDGIIHCIDASDELNCHLLESNKCDVDEYQCRNGMCIPTEFAFDVALDCMDLSDEQDSSRVHTLFDYCWAESKTECDERLCRKDQFSCGNGLCVHWSALMNQKNGCRNARHAAYLCEIFDTFITDRKELIGICHQTMLQLPALTNASDCIISLRQLLNANQNKLSNKTREIALNNIIDRCPELIEYPNQTMISPILKIFYNKSLIQSFYHNQENFNRQLPKRPHLYCLNGLFICHGIQVTLEKDFCMSDEEFQKLTSFPYLPISHLFCQVAVNKKALFRNLIHNSSNTTFIYSCVNTSDRLSHRRLNDGYSDCPYGDDEKNSLYVMTQPFRYQCQTVSSPNQYISFQQLGNGINDCTDQSDEISREVRWSMLTCDDDDSYACWVFQGDGINEDRIKNVRLSYHRHCDSVWDTMDGRDEMNCSQWICADGTYRCNRTGQCIDRTYFCDGEFDCDDGEEELSCDSPLRQWNFQNGCNIINEHFCITSQYLRDPNFVRPCIPYMKAGDGQIDCIGGRDERNVFSCPDHRALGDRFLCDNQTKCLNYTVLCNGIDDCFDRSDELICFWNRSRCTVGQFGCADRGACINRRCNALEKCTDKSHWFWCPNPIKTVVTDYRSGKYERLLNYEESCYKHSTVRQITNNPTELLIFTNARDAIQPVMKGYCNRGFYLHMPNDAKIACFCPPSYYGDRCQYDSRRVTVRVRIDRHHRDDIPEVLTVLVLLILNQSEIVDHQFFVDWNKHFSTKYNIYLLYPRPRRKGLYSVRLEAYHSIDLLAAWEYRISPFDFLPAFRLAKILRFPERILPWFCLQNRCQNNGTCYMMNNDQNLCLCQRGWQGIDCEKPLYDIKCASHAIVRDRHVCICRYGYLEPHCFVRNTICEQSHSCSINEECYAISHQPPDRYWCVCDVLNCDIRYKLIIIHRQKTNQLPYLLQLLKISSDYPRLQQQFLIHPSTNFPISTVIKTHNIRDVEEPIPEIGLFFTFEPLVQSVDIILHLLFINCSKSRRNYTVDLDIQPQRCQSVQETEFRSIKLLDNFCQESARNSCFALQDYICYCSSQMIRKSECITYHQRHTTCTHCYNQGYCVQGDLQNRSDFTCVCPRCVSGKLCQFSSSRFSISLEFLVERTQWGSYHLIIPILFLAVGMIFNGLCIITFTQPKTRRSGTGLYLLFNSILSQSVFIILCVRVIHLHLSRHIIINQETNRILCKSLPYLTISLYYISLWLMALVTVERALAVILPTQLLFLRTPKSAALLSLLTSLVIFGSNYPHINHFKLVSHPDDMYSWCISEVEPKQQYFMQYMSLAHHISPFLINLTASLAVIIGISRSKASSHHLLARDVLLEQVRQRIDLLLGPVICFLTQLPQLVVLFLNICDDDSKTQYVHFILVAYYISFTPQINLFLLYLLPSSLYKEVLFTETTVGRILRRIIHRNSHLQQR